VTSSRRSVLSRFSALAVAVLLAGCAGGPREPTPSDYPIHGIDISRWQGNIDWHTVRRSDAVHFAFIKATEGGDHVDPLFFQNWEGAKRAGVPRGAYHFVYWCRPAHEQMLWFRRVVPNDPTSLPPVLDLEWNNHSKTCPNGASKETARAMTAVMLREMEAHTGKRPIIYTDMNFYNDVLKGHFRDYHFWPRSVPRHPAPRFTDRNWTFWQYTAKGRVPGIGEEVDRNAFNGSRRQWNAWLKQATRARRTVPYSPPPALAVMPAAPVSVAMAEPPAALAGVELTGGVPLPQPRF
jgi:lysozyme